MQQHLPTHPAHPGPAGLSPGMINPHNAMAAAAGLPNPSGLLGKKIF